MTLNKLLSTDDLISVFDGKSVEGSPEVGFSSFLSWSGRAEDKEILLEMGVAESSKNISS